MKSLWVVLALCLLTVSGCSGEDLKKQVEKKNQIITAQEAEIKKIKDDMAAREADLKNQYEQRLQKLTAQTKQQVDALQARIAELTKKKDADAKAKAGASKTSPSKDKSASSKNRSGR